ncbi:MAG: autotransporter-associated beta strand repeat-containing protein, partial [Planctomycetes bacterium]|nr:autotransporter-associated beta strand repeat-containing protein [Planctomycetota bacterium]
MIAHGVARTIASRIATPEDVGCLSASFFAGSLREQRQDDWRTTRPPAGTRSDSVLNFPYAEHALFPTADAQRAAGIPCNDSGYSTYSVQWDGFLAVPVAGTRLLALTSDGCRVAIDRDRDGVLALGEWSQDAWGGGHDPPLLARLGAPLAAGVHPLRIQFEQTGNLGGFSLMWDDASHRAGMCQGRPVVPKEFLIGTGALEIGGDQAIRLEGTLSGASWLIKSGPSALTIAGADLRSGSTVVAAGSLHCGADQVLPPRALVVSAGATLALDGHGQTIGTLSGAGAIDLGAAVLSLGADDQSGTFAGAITGSGGIRKVGAGTALLDGASSYTGRTDVSGGTLRRADGTIAVQVPLTAPITTIVALPTPPGDERVVDAWITVPADAPPDLGVGAFIVDQHGRWFQRIDPERLPPGRSHRRFDLGATQNLCSQPGLALWTALQATVATRAGLFFWSASASRCAIGIEGRVSGQATPVAADVVPIASTQVPTAIVPSASTATTASSQPRLCECASPPGPAHTGERWQVSVLPAPFPGNPYDSDEFALDAVITGPDHATITLPGFFEQPMRSSDRGDREDVVPAGGGHFTVRFRPRLPGRHQVRLTARWKGGGSVESALPDVEVAGEPWDGYVHVDRADPRFFSIGGGEGTPGAFFWPVGISLRSINDVLSQRSMKTRLTPERGTLSYAAYLERFGRSGGTAAEIWMSSWNLALEWRGDWVGFYGPGRYNQDNAWRLDRILDLAWQNGVRINLVLHNHGQASDRDDHEWKDNPYNHDLGGVLTSPGQIFTDRRSLAAQEKLRRYIIARYADHPAVMGWKLWTEINLTASNPVALRTWHDQASARWHQLDVYQHPVTTHWSMDYHVADRAIIALTGIDYVCLDAYHDEGHPLASLLKEGMSPSGLGGIGKPVLVNEYGANWQGGSDAWMAADHASGAWLSLVTGYGGSPMMWWYEWVDQKDRWAPYGAIARFLVGEDLRGSDAHGTACEAASAAGALTCLGWQRPGHLLGYVIDQQWGAHGTHD